MADGEDEVPQPQAVRRRVRRRTGTRAKTISIKRMSKESKEAQRLGRALYPPTDDGLAERPKTRGDCYKMERPCPFVSCKWHLFLDINPLTGSIKHNFPDKEVWELEETCALDVADRNGCTLDDVGVLMNLTRERVRQVEVRATQKLANGILAREPELADDLRESLHAEWPEVPSPSPQELARQMAQVLLLAQIAEASTNGGGIGVSDDGARDATTPAPAAGTARSRAPCSTCDADDHDGQACPLVHDGDAT